MRAAALSLAGIPARDPDSYRAGLANLLESLRPCLAVLPAHTGLHLHRNWREGKEKCDFTGAWRAYAAEAPAWKQIYLDLHAALAARFRLCLVAGTVLEEDAGRIYHTAYCFGPAGEILAAQRQTHLSREERELGLSRGVELAVVNAGGCRLGLVVATDARHPEVGRILAFQGADILVHTGALEAAPGGMSRQLAGMWASAQQNECWAVEAQFHGKICGREFGGRCAVLGPCVTAADYSGYLALPAPGEPAASAQFDLPERHRAGEAFPVLRQINPRAYRGVLY